MTVGVEVLVGVDVSVGPPGVLVDVLVGVGVLGVEVGIGVFVGFFGVCVGEGPAVFVGLGVLVGAGGRGVPTTSTFTKMVRAFSEVISKPVNPKNAIMGE